LGTVASQAAVPLFSFSCFAATVACDREAWVSVLCAGARSAPLRVLSGLRYRRERRPGVF